MSPDAQPSSVPSVIRKVDMSLLGLPPPTTWMHVTLFKVLKMLHQYIPNLVPEGVPAIEQSSGEVNGSAGCEHSAPSCRSQRWDPIGRKRWGGNALRGAHLTSTREELPSSSQHGSSARSSLLVSRRPFSTALPSFLSLLALPWLLLYPIHKLAQCSCM